MQKYYFIYICIEPVTNVEPIFLDLTESPIAAIDGISNNVGEIVDLVTPKSVDEDNEKDTDIEILEEPASLPKGNQIHIRQRIR